MNGPYQEQQKENHKKDLDDDDDVQDSDIEIQEIDRQAQVKKYLADYKKDQAAKAQPKQKTYDKKIWA